LDDPAAVRGPFRGIGKPEPLKYVLAGAWSRRITEEHRLVYAVSAGRVDFLQARTEAGSIDGRGPGWEALGEATWSASGSQS
jgi:hypothetical protein